MDRGIGLFSVLMGAVLVGYWFWHKKKMKRVGVGGEVVAKKSGVPKGSLGWPFIGETLDFIACGYTSRPVSFMDKRKSL